MKWCYRLCLLTLIPVLIFSPLHKVFARDVILVESMAGRDSGLLVKKILLTKFQLPEKLITLRIIKSGCDVKSDAIVHLCLLPTGELSVLKMNDFVVKNSFGIFMNQEKTGDEKNE